MRHDTTYADWKKMWDSFDRPKWSFDTKAKTLLKKFPNITKAQMEAYDESRDTTKQLLRELDYYKEHYNKSQKNSGLVNEILDLLSKHIQPINEIKPWVEENPSKKLPEESLLCMNADQHIGFIVDKFEAPNEGMTYNTDIARKRVMQYSKLVLKITQYHRKFERINDCHLVYLGDGLEGDWKGLNQSKDNIVDQYVNGFTTFAEQIEFFAKNFKNVYIHSIFGNHSRMDKGQPEYVNWEYIFWATVMQLKFSNTPNVKFNVPSTPFGFFNIYDKKFCMLHGGGIKMSYKTPYYGIESAHKEYNEIFQDLEAGRFDYLLLGHFHNPASLNNNKIKICGSTVGYHPWSMSALRKYTPPSQKMCFVHKEHGIVEDRDIYL